MSNAAESAHDTRLLELHREWAQAEQQLGWAMNTIMQSTDKRSQAESYRNFKRVPDPRPFSEALATMQAAVAEGEGYDAKYSWPKYLDRYETTKVAAQAARQAVLDHEDRYTGWTRFWLVTSSPGHVHKSRHCSSCNFKTTYALVPTLSALTEQAAVETFGPAMCSVCFPSAPTGAKISKALAESVGTPQWDKNLAKHQAKNGMAA